MTALPLSPFIVDTEHRFVLDEKLFLDAIMFDAPDFLRNPREEYLRACDIKPVLETLAGY